MKRLVIALALSFLMMSLAAQNELLDVTGSMPLRLDGDGTYELQWYSVQGSANELLVIEAVSLDFAPYLEIETPDGRYSSAYGDNNGAAISVFSSESGVWRIGVGYLEARRNGTGSFFLKARSIADRPPLSIGETRRGSLSPELAYDSDYGRYIDWLPMILEPGMRLRLLLESSDFDAYMFLMFEDGEIRTYDDGSGRDSLATLVSDRRQTVMVGASSYSGESRGVYFLTVEELGEPENIVINETAEGRLGAGTAGPFYRFVAPEDGDYLVSLSSDEFDTYLKVSGPDGFEMENDDGPGGGTDSAIWISLMAGQEALIEVSAWSDGGGYYYLQVSGARTISVGEEVRDILMGTALFSLEGRSGEYVTIELVSDDFDTYLGISDDWGNGAENDDSYVEGYNYASSINHFFAGDGSIDISVSSYYGGDGGEYLLRVLPYEGPMPEDYPSGYELTPGDRVTAMISYDDDGFDFGPGDSYSLFAEQGDQIRVSMSSDAIDSFLSLVAPDGQEFYDDDSLGGYNSLIDIVAPVSGRYQLVASAYDGSVGIYELSYDSAGRANVLLQMEGAIEDGDERDSFDKPFDVYDLPLEYGETVRISVSSQDFDTRLFINDPDGEPFAENDDFNGTDSLVEITAGETGTYSIVVMPYSGSERGRYEVQVIQW
jgi:hypothetical protein